MPVFTYAGKNAANEKVSGERTAENKHALAGQLRRERITPGPIKEKGKEFALPTFGSNRVKPKELAIFFRQFAVMIDAGLPLVQCLEILASNQDNTAFQRALTGVRTTVEGGSTLANAMRTFPKIFDALTTNMIEAGETGGILDTILNRLALYVEKIVKMRSAVKSALIYPVSVICMSVLIVAGLLKWVVPKFIMMFDGLNVELPLPTRCVIALSEFVQAFWWVGIGGIVALVIGLRLARRTEKGRYIWDAVLLRLPIFGMVLRKIAVARFTRTLGTLITSGVPILEGLLITAKTSGNAVLERALMKVRKSIEEGRTIVDPLREANVFPPMVTQMIGVGEATGAMDAMLQKIADFYEDEVDAATKNLLTLMEPLMIAILGFSVGGIVISLYLPLFSIINKLNPGAKLRRGARREGRREMHGQGEEIGIVNEATWLSWLVRARILLITVLLGIELVIISFTYTNVNKRLFLCVIVVWYAIAVFYALLLQWWRETRIQARLQILTDVAFTAAILYVSGGIDTYFNCVYPLLIIVAAILLPRWWPYATAALSFISFGAILELSFFDVIPSYSSSRPDLKSLQAVIFVNLFGYLGIAYLASHLSTKLRAIDLRLKEQSGRLQNLKALHESIFNSVSGGLVITNLEGAVNLVNPAAERMLERPAEELAGRPLNQFLQDRLPYPGDASAHAEVRSITPSGTVKVFAATNCELRVPGQDVVGSVYSFEDLTEIRRLEREVRMRDRMAAVGRMAAGIAHEIRNPLTSIAGSVHMLTELAAMDDEQLTLVSIVKRESERLNNIIGDFLAYSREKDFNFAEQDLVALAEDALALLENRPEIAPAGNVKITREYDVPEALALVDGDRMKQVFWNICDNAIRAMTGGGALAVGIREGEEGWLVTFRDTGPGLNPQQCEKVFEPFQSGFVGGTGLGLAIVYQIVQGHEGKVSVQSEPGLGTEFRVELKRLEPAEMAIRHLNETTARSLGTPIGAAAR